MHAEQFSGLVVAGSNHQIAVDGNNPIGRTAQDALAKITLLLQMLIKGNVFNRFGRLGGKDVDDVNIDAGQRGINLVQ